MSGGVQCHLGINVRGVTHAGESLTPPTPGSVTMMGSLDCDNNLASIPSMHAHTHTLLCVYMQISIDFLQP